MEAMKRAATRVGPWLGLPATGALWAIWHLRKSYFFFDEWSLIHLVTHLDGPDGMIYSFNGHLWMLQYWLYRIQVSVFGLDNHVFISVCFVVALIALHLSMAALLRAHGLPRQFCLMVGGLLTYMGAASTDFIFAVQVSPVLSMAAGVFAAAIVVRYEPSTRAITGAALCMVASMVLESGIALGGVTLAGVLAVMRWRSKAVWALSPVVLVMLWWYTTADFGQSYPASFGGRLSFSVRLLLHAVGALVGKGDIAGALLGLVAAALIGFGLVRRWLDARTVATLVAGLAAAAVTIGALAYARAGMAGINFRAFNRYLQFAAIPLVMGATPALAAVTRRAVDGVPMHPATRAIPALGIVAAFLLALGPLNTYTKIFDGLNVRTREEVLAATIVIAQGCPSGVAPDPTSFPVLDHPQITTQLLADLVARGALSVGKPEDYDPFITERMCPTT